MSKLLSNRTYFRFMPNKIIFRSKLNIFNPIIVEPVIQEPQDPCNPDPCGPNSECRPQGSRPVCTCLPGYFGGPPNCRPECLLSSECQLTKACVQQHCVDLCPGTCGANAECKVVNHNPICSCPRGYSGDPFFNCNKNPEVVIFLVFPHHVDLMLSAEKSMDMKLALVLQGILAIRQTVAQNVSSMRNVQVTRPVSSRSALIPVLVPVGIMPGVRQLTTMPSVLALQGTLAIHSLDVPSSQK